MWPAHVTSSPAAELGFKHVSSYATTMLLQPSSAKNIEVLKQTPSNSFITTFKFIFLYPSFPPVSGRSWFYSVFLKVFSIVHEQSYLLPFLTFQLSADDSQIFLWAPTAISNQKEGHIFLVTHLYIHHIPLPHPLSSLWLIMSALLLLSNPGTSIPPYFCSYWFEMLSFSLLVEILFIL